MTQLSRERLETIAAWREKYGENHNVMLPASEAEEMARRLLAAEAQDPVAYMYHDNLHADARFSLEPRFGNWSPEDINEYEITETKLYAAPQPVAVPDDKQLRALFDAWFASDCSFDRSPDAIEEDNIAWRESYWYVWQRCAAMLMPRGEAAPLLDFDAKDSDSSAREKGLQPLSSNEPVSQTYTLPDGWKLVPVEPTAEMMLHKSGCQRHAWDDPDCSMRQTRRLVWANMLAAAPQEPTK